MKKIIVLITLVLLLIVLASCSNESEIKDFKGVRVAVSIIPQERFVREVGGDLVDVVSMIPAGASPANYQPTPREMMKLSEADLYFSIGVAAERANIIPRIEDMNEDVILISLEEKVAEIYPSLVNVDHEHDEEKTHDELLEDADPHIWLSTKRAVLMVEIIRDSLVEFDSENSDIYKKNAAEYIEELNNLNLRLEKAFNDLENKSFIIYHPSYGYLADDYGLEMVTVEEDGKEATVESLKNIIDFAREREIKVIFYQDEFDSSQAETIAKEIDGSAVAVSPLSYDYIEAMEDILEKLDQVFK